MNDANNGNPLEGEIRREIEARGGPISFARYMELALYTPELGYYERSGQQVGRSGDFYTSVSVGPVFGELLAFQFAHWLDALDPSEPAHLVEAGAHDGRLAADLLHWLEHHRPQLWPRITLHLVEPSERRRQWQATTLAAYANRVRWVQNLEELQAVTGGASGVFYSNELLDAFPVHRVCWRAQSGHWEELGVGWTETGLTWQTLPEQSEAIRTGLEWLQQLPRELLSVLPEGFTTELGPAAASWWSDAARSLRRGHLITFDYGLEATEFLLPQRSKGTLRTYSGHRLGDDLLQRPGELDLTAHVNFSVLEDAGTQAGLTTDYRGSQRQWLTSVFSETVKRPAEFPAWDSRRVRQFQTLTHPEHLGRSFRVLVQRR